MEFETHNFLIRIERAEALGGLTDSQEELLDDLHKYFAAKSASPSEPRTENSPEETCSQNTKAGDGACAGAVLTGAALSPIPEKICPDCGRSNVITVTAKTFHGCYTCGLAYAEPRRDERGRAIQIVIEELNSSTGPTGGWLDSPKAICAEIVARLEGGAARASAAPLPQADKEKL
jgi:hypothetical protein